MKNKIYPIMIASILFLSGCESKFGDSGFFKSTQDTYAHSQNGRMLVVPPPISSNKIKHSFVIQDGQHRATPVPVPPGSLLEKEMQKGK